MNIKYEAVFILKENCEKLLKDFFKTLRERNREIKNG